MTKLTPTEFIYNKYPIVKGRIDSDLLNNFSGNELISLIEEYLIEANKSERYYKVDPFNDSALLIYEYGTTEEHIISQEDIILDDINTTKEDVILKIADEWNAVKIINMDIFQDIAENPKNYPSNLVELNNTMWNDYIKGGLDYENLPIHLKKFESIGYSFDYGLDAEPYDLKKLV